MVSFCQFYLSKVGFVWFCFVLRQGLTNVALGWPGTPHIDLGDLSASVSQGLGLMVCTLYLAFKKHVLSFFWKTCGVCMVALPSPTSAPGQFDLWLILGTGFIYLFIFCLPCCV